MIRIATITPPDPTDYLFLTVMDGLHTLEREGLVKFFFATLENLKETKEADLIILLNSKRGTNDTLAEAIGRWDKTVYIDGTELGKNNRLDIAIQQQVFDGIYDGCGAINQEMLKKCALYFRREKPYINGIIPLPFGIERRYIHYKPGQKKDIDFACIFGQDEYPPLRRQAREFLESWCKKNSLTYATAHTNSIFNRDFRNEKSQARFYNILARTKVGISVGGGGFDTLRFWEILANNCALLTENIAIYEPGSLALSYKRIFQFQNILEFEQHLTMFAKMMKHDGWPCTTDVAEYQSILDTHSTKARVLSIINHAQQRGIL